MGLVETVTGESVGTGDDATVLFNLDHTPSNEPTVYVDAVEQVLDTDYTRSGGAITFTSAPATDAVITADYEWTRTAVRIYALQLWTDGISTQLGARAFASSEDPLVIAFGNRETVKEVSLTSPLSVTIDPTGNPAHIPPSGASAYSLLAYAEYDPLSQETALGAEPVNADDFVKLGTIREQLSSAGWGVSYSGYTNISSFFDGNWGNYSSLEGSGSFTFQAPVGVYYPFIGMKVKPFFTQSNSSIWAEVQYMDSSMTWTTVDKRYYGDTDLNRTITLFFDAPIMVNQVRFRSYGFASRAAGWYEVELYCFDIPGIGTAGRKFGNGIVQLYDSAEEEWVEKNRVYLGTLNIGKGLDGEWAVNGFVPFNMPPQNLVPFPKATFPARW